MGIERKSDDFDSLIGPEMVNGTILSHQWDGVGGHTLHFPQVDPNLDPLDPIDPTIKIGKDDKKANKVFEFAKRLAKTMTNADEICRKVGEYAKSLGQEAPLATTASDTRERVQNLEMWGSGDKNVYQV